MDDSDQPSASPMSLAFEWVARIIAVSLLMFLPGVAGQWLDARFQTGFLALVGFAFGFCAGLTVLLAMVKGRSQTVGSVSARSKNLGQRDGDRER